MKLRPLFWLTYVLIVFFMISCDKKNYKKLDNGIVLTSESADLQIEACSAKIIRVQYIPKDPIKNHSSLIVTKEWKPVKFDVKQKDGTITLFTDSISVKIDIATQMVSFFDKENKKIVSENRREVFADTVLNEPIYNLSQSWQLSEDEGIYGLGQLQDGYMNYRNTIDTLIQTNTVAVNPFLISTKSYGILWDNYSKTIFKDDKSGASFNSEVGDKIDYYFIAGANMDDVISGYRDATGKAPMFGKWAFGYWQSKERYKNYEELKSVVQKYRDLKIPLDNIVQDWCYWAEYDADDGAATWNSAQEHWSSMYFDPSTYKDPKGAIKELHEKYNVHYMISIWPILGTKTEIYKEMKEAGHIYPIKHWTNGQLYDAYSKEARDIYWKHVKKGVLDMGADALWMDGTEPELGDQHTFKVSERNIKKLGQSEIGSMARYMNAFSLVTTSGAYENFRRDFPNKRFFTLTRSAFAGQQRNAAATWSGDINARFDVLRSQIASGINFCMSGIPYWTTDIGAFFIKDRDVGHGPGQYPGGHTDPSYQELYVRWFQYGAFNPLFRSHGTQTPREVWQFGEKGEWGYETLLKYDNLRYRLLPYIYSLAWKVTNEDYTMMRGLPMDFTQDQNVYNIDNQFMFGPSIMATPVTEHQYFPLGEDKSKHGLKEIKKTKVYLPSGTDWYDFWSGAKIKGGQKIARETPIDIMPLYVKAGSIIPMGPYKQYATEKVEDPIELRIYTGANAEFKLYEDENDNYNYEKGIFATIDFKWNEKEQKLTIKKRKGTFPGLQVERKIHVVWVDQDHGIGVDIANPDSIINYVGNKIELIRQ